MDALALLAEAEAAGLEVRREGERLVVRGPKSAEELATRILDHKDELLAIVAPPTPPTVAQPRGGHCLKCKVPTRTIRDILCDDCNARRHGLGQEDRATPRPHVSAVRGAGPGPSAAVCATHGRFLTGRELDAGCCSWCEPDRFDWSEKDRAAIEAMSAPKEFPTFTCLRPGCFKRFVAGSGRTLYCSDGCHRRDAKENPL